MKIRPVGAAWFNGRQTGGLDITNSRFSEFRKKRLLVIKYY